MKKLLLLILGVLLAGPLLAQTLPNPSFRWAVYVDYPGFAGGAKMDGSTDDTAAWNAALAYLCSKGGGVLNIPQGSTVIDGVVVNCNGIHIKGAGKSATYIQAKTATGNPIKFGNGATPVYDLSLEGVTVAGFLTGGVTLPTSGSLVRVSLVNSFTMRDFSIVNWSTGLLLDGGSVAIKVSDGMFVNGTPTTGRGIDINNALGSIHHINITGSAAAPNQPYGGIVIRNSAGFWFDTIDEIQSGFGMAIVPVGTDPVKYIWVSNSDFDSNTNGGFVVAGSSTGPIATLKFSNTNFSSNGVLGQATGVSGVLLSATTLNSIIFTECDALNNSGDGFTFNAGTNITVDGGSRAYGNNWATNAFYSGVSVGVGISHVAVRNSRIGLPVGEFANPPSPAQLRGIFIASGGSDYLDISHNDLTGNGAAILDQSTGTNSVIRSNRGWNPVGTSAITVGGSPFTYTAGHSPETIYIKGGTVSGVTQAGGTILTASPGTVALEPNESIIVTYSVAPTMQKMIH